MTSILNDTTPRLTRHLSDHHAVQGEAEYVERHAPITASHTPPQKEASMTTYMQRDGRITSAATEDMPERIWLSPEGAHLPYQPTMHWEWQEYRRIDLCASGQVRSLEWTPGTYTTRDDDGGKREGFPRRLFAWMAENYLIIQQDSPDGLFLLRGKSDGTGLAVPTLEAAKAAAQADYERRILAALTPDPQAEGQVRTLDPRVSLLEDLSAEDFLKDVDGCIDAGSDREDKALDEIAALTPTGWQPIETAPHETLVVLGWYDGDVWKQEIALASAGTRWENGYSNMWQHGRATHWMPLAAAPAAEGGSDER